MMSDFIRYFLPVYFIIYFMIAFVLKSWIVARRIGKNPLVLPEDDSAYGLVGLYFKLILIALFVYVMVFACFNQLHDHFLPVTLLNHSLIKYTGISLMIVSFIWTLTAQMHMKNSWRIGIDNETKTELVTSGLFSVSRNPVFFGMILSLAGLFLVTPDAFTFLFLITGYMLIQIQIRLEEEFLLKEHGQEYLNYKNKVRRLV
jgi:protein-S-isoprenylcysteine O-methyltransferase Ste14